jgi:DNA-binding MarR family transcriptional regulator
MARDTAAGTGPTDEDFVALLEFRDGLRRFLQWSETQAKAAGLTATQHQLLLAIRGHRGDPSIGEVAEHLLLRHHSVVELVDRVERLGLVRRLPDAHDQRVVRLALTAKGTRTLSTLSAAHLEELSRIRPSFSVLWRDGGAGSPAP